MKSVGGCSNTDYFGTRIKIGREKAPMRSSILVVLLMTFMPANFKCLSKSKYDALWGASVSDRVSPKITGGPI